MTQWIDDLVSKLDTTQQRNNEENALQLHLAGLIKARAPLFFSEILKKVAELAAELNQKLATLGGVEARFSGPESFAVNSKGQKTLSISGRLNLHGHQIEIDSTMEGPLIAGTGRHETFKLKIDNNNELYAVSADGTHFADGSQLADEIMRRYFTHVVLR